MQGSKALKMNATRANSLHYHRGDLGSTFIEAFYWRPLFGQTPFGRDTSFEYLICRGRYLLSVVDESHLSDMLLGDQIDGPYNPYASLYYADAIGAWLSGLVKARQHIPLLDDLLRQAKVNPHEFFRSVNYRTVALHAAALLMDEPGHFAQLFQQRLKDLQGGDEQNQLDRTLLASFALAALLWLDARHGWSHAQAFLNLVPERDLESAQRQLTRFLDMAQLLRCGFEFADRIQLQSLLRSFIAGSTPVEFQLQGALQEPTLRPYQAIDWAHANQAYQAKKAQFLQQHAIYFRLGLPLPLDRAQQFLVDTGSKSLFTRAFKPARDTFLFKRAQAWLSGADPDPFWLRIGVGAANNAFDILATLELDLHYRISADLIDVLYQKLAGLIPFDATMYRQYASDLLLRSAAYDAKACQLLTQADTLAAGQKKLRDYPMLKMPRAAAEIGWYPCQVQ